MRRLWLIGVFAIVALFLLRVAPYSIAHVLGLLMAEPSSRPGWVILPPDARIFSDGDDLPRKPGRLSGRTDLFTRMDAAAGRDFYMHALAAEGFTAHDQGIGNLSPREAEILGISGTIRAERPSDHVSMTIELAGREGLIQKSLLVVVYWRNYIP